MKSNRITLITLGVGDVAAARSFYERLGLKAMEGPDTVAFFDCGGFRLGLFGREALEAQMARHGAALQVARRDALIRLAAAQARDGPFPAADLALVQPDGPEIDTEEALRDAFAESRARDRAAGRTLVGPHRADLAATYAAKDMEARLCSTGEQKALLISLLLANARALRDDGGAPILLLDEVAAHLDADRRAALYAELADLGGQAFLTGTGRELFADLGPDAHHLRVVEQDGESRTEEAAP